MGTESGGSPAILLLGNGGDELKKALGLEWGAGKSCIGNGGDVNKKWKKTYEEQKSGRAWTWSDGRVSEGRQERERREKREMREIKGKRKINKNII